MPRPRGRHVSGEGGNFLAFHFCVSDFLLGAAVCLVPSAGPHHHDAVILTTVHVVLMCVSSPVGWQMEQQGQRSCQRRSSGQREASKLGSALQPSGGQVEHCPGAHVLQHARAAEKNVQAAVQGTD